MPLTPEMLQAIVILTARYGPDVVLGIEGLFKKANPTTDDVKAVFANLKPYSDFGIPDKVS